MDLDLREKRVLVTGSTRGIGRATAEHFLKEGARVVLTGRGEADLRRVRDELALRYAASDVLCRTCDFRSPADIRVLREFITSSWDGLDILVANVGHGVSVPIPYRGESTWKRSLPRTFTVPSIRPGSSFLSLRHPGKHRFRVIHSRGGGVRAPVDFYSVAKTAVIA